MALLRSKLFAGVMFAGNLLGLRIVQPSNVYRDIKLITTMHSTKFNINSFNISFAVKSRPSAR